MTETPTVTSDDIVALIRDYAQDRITEADVRRAMESAAPDLDLFRDVGSTLGLADLFLPTRYGGMGADLSHAVAAFGELGRALAWGPFLPTFGVAVPLLAALRPGPDVDATVAAVRAGAGVGVLVGDGLVVAGSGPDLVRVSGSLCNVVGGAEVGAFLALVPIHGALSVVEVDAADPGVAISPIGCLDLTRRLADIVLDGAMARVLPADPAIDPASVWDAALDRAALLHAASTLGTSRRLFELAVDHARNRLQFGRPIGSFQAVKHRCARMLVEQRLAEAAVERAARATDVERPVAVAAAVVVARHTAHFVTANALQVFGGIGFTWEHPAHLYFKRATVDRHLLDDLDRHRRRIAQAIGA